MRKRHAVLRLLAALAVLAAATGCRADDQEAGTEEASTDLRVEASEYAFEPSAVTVPAGEEVSVTLDNQGQLAHDWVVIEQGTTVEDTASFSDDVAYFEMEAPAGETTSATFTAPEAGTYQLLCAESGHIEQGMTGTLEVVAAD